MSVETSATVPVLGASAPMPQPSRWRQWKVALCLLAIFLCGLALGIFGTIHRLRREVSRRADPANWTQILLPQLGRRLHLTPEQRRALEPILLSAAGETMEIRNRAFGEVGEVVRRAQAKASPQLLPDQQRRLDEFIAERAALIHRWAGPAPVPRSAAGKNDSPDHP